MQGAVTNVKLLGYRANSDGIDICNSRNVTVQGCFVRTLDDLIVVKTDKGQGRPAARRTQGLRRHPCDRERFIPIGGGERKTADVGRRAEEGICAKRRGPALSFLRTGF